jgi:spore maturation protein CgeB
LSTEEQLMHIAIFGLTVSSSWGNGHATLWRGLLRAMTRRGHTVSFYERDVPYYASTRDGWTAPAGVSVHHYESVAEIEREARSDLDAADLALCTSFCPDGAFVARLILDSRAAIKAFYDLDTPVTLDAMSAGEPVPYLPLDGLAPFDLVLSFTGGKALDELYTRLGARAVAPLYGSVDPGAHFPVTPVRQFRGALSYLGTYAADRQRALEELFIEPARCLPQVWFRLAGAQYPEDFPWQPNIAFARHLDPAQHPAFLCSSRATLNVTRGAMARYGFCPSGRLFEAAACGAPILSDCWEGLEGFFAPGEEILCVHSAVDVISALALSDAELRRIAKAAQTRVLEKHTAERRVQELETICERIVAGAEQPAIAS